MKYHFEKYIIDNQLFTKNDKLLIAVSGGMDSVILVHLLKLNNYQFAIVHCNFQLRGSESEQDEAFVRERCHQLSVELFE